MTERKRWMGSAPKGCDICRKDLDGNFVDGATKMGPWANMCLPCHERYGRGLGTGKGQKYRCEADGVFYKVEG